MKRICVTCGSSPGFDPCYMAMARALGQAIVDHGLDLVYGVADVGLMGEIADTVLAGNRSVIGVIPKSFAGKVSHTGLTELHVVDSMHDRKAMMFDISDAFVALPGGFGTLEEVSELMTWAQLGFHQKPCGLINVAGYFDPLLSFLDGAVSNGFMKREHRDMLIVSDNPASLFGRFENYEAPDVEKWMHQTLSASVAPAVGQRTRMANLLITGMSGVGKTSVLKRLRAYGYRCVDMDDPGWSFMDNNGHQHWDTERLSSVLDDARDEPMAVAGCAKEQGGFYCRFNVIVLLSAPLDVMIKRIRSRHSNGFGHKEEEMKRILQDKEQVEPLLRRSCTHEIVTTAPLSSVVHEVLAIAAQQGGPPAAIGAGDRERSPEKR